MNTPIKLFALSLLLYLASAPVRAQQPPSALDGVVNALLARETAGLPGEVSLSVGTLDDRNLLPACEALEAFLPAGTRAWGQISVGVRCLGPVAWTVYVPVKVSVVSDYLVTARPIRPGQIIGPSDIERRRGDLAALGDRTLTAAEQAMGHYVRYAVAAGQALRSDMLRLPDAIKQGQTVRVIGIGERFQVANEGRAMNRAAEGEPVRVRLANGQVVSGIARHGGIVEVRF